MAAQRAPRVVAELGRPETPEETAARKAANSKKHRQNQTTLNLVFALIASLVVVLVIVLLVPRSDTPIERDVDVSAIAEQAQVGASAPLVVPELPDGWRPNAAEIRTGSDDITAWYVGLLTPGDEYLGVYQGFDANDTWVASLLARTLATGVVEIDGVEWTVYDNRESGDDVGNARYGLVTTSNDTTFVLLGTASPEEFATFATAITPTIQAQ
ncbi:DUF4245 domain-containing protein [Agromyces larvae]|uniref:DUF4245 domain-containing protein n=1 Tax=Agromyces larvae TaxID=2929802 RepID=A0ABY4C2R7_9MICO|nr:DUF4245 domain-containing protein [Agromyces larvae]UOE45690.1 DUF4245 domain-containing protein [Agromyces larvae]